MTEKQKELLKQHFFETWTIDHPTKITLNGVEYRFRKGKWWEKGYKISSAMEAKLEKGTLKYLRKKFYFMFDVPTDTKWNEEKAKDLALEYLKNNMKPSEIRRRLPSICALFRRKLKAPFAAVAIYEALCRLFGEKIESTASIIAYSAALNDMGDSIGAERVLPRAEKLREPNDANAERYIARLKSKIDGHFEFPGVPRFPTDKIAE